MPAPAGVTCLVNQPPLEQAESIGRVLSVQQHFDPSRDLPLPVFIRAIQHVRLLRRESAPNFSPDATAIAAASMNHVLPSRGCECSNDVSSRATSGSMRTRRAGPFAASSIASAAVMLPSTLSAPNRCGRSTSTRLGAGAGLGALTMVGAGVARRALRARRLCVRLTRGRRRRARARRLRFITLSRSV